MGLLDYGYDEMPKLYDSTFAILFHSCGIITPPSLPAMKLAKNCYRQMFYGSKLILAPRLPAIELDINCYTEMFEWCESLKKIFTMNHIKKVEQNSCENMFYLCNNFNMTTEHIPGSNIFSFREDIVTAQRWNYKFYYRNNVTPSITIEPTPGVYYYINY